MRSPFARSLFVIGILSSLSQDVTMPASVRSLGVFASVLIPCVACTSEPSGGGNEGPPSTGIELQLVGNTFDFPVFLTSPPGDASRLFVVEKDGLIRIQESGGIRPTPFLDLTAITTKGSEQGLLGMAFAPDYATSGRFFVSYTTNSPAPAGKSVIARYHVSADPNVADPVADATVIEADQPYSNHNGGMIAFGPDGFLYIGLGDGGSGGDPDGHGQDRTELLGSLLRLDVSGATYTIPPGNPFAGTAGLRGELWNYGLRNPWRFSFDRQTDDLYIGDVGQGSLEEVDVQSAASAGGENYGWNRMEGFSCYNRSTCNKTGLTRPMLDYGHGPGCSVTGGYVYRGSAIPQVQGVYFYSDYCDGTIRSFVYQNGRATHKTSWPDADPNGSVTSFGEDSSGELYVLTSGGSVYKIIAAP